MLLPRAPLSLLGVALGSFVAGAFCGSPSHSLCYFYLHLPEPSWGLPQFFIRGYLDDQPIVHFDSLTGKLEPLVPWMEEAEKGAFLSFKWVFRNDLEKLSNLDHNAEGLHTWQVVLCCELSEDGRKRGFFHYGYNGRDFISFDKQTLTWVADQPQAQKVKEKWNNNPGWSQGNKVYLEETCIEWLQRYLSYQNKTLKRTEPPVGKVTHKVVDDRLEVLICQAFGFYPKEIQATWTRDGEVCQNETLPRNVAPNSDGTYYVRLSIEINPKKRDPFRCHLEHEGLQEPLVLAWEEKTAIMLFGFVGAVMIIIAGALNLFLTGHCLIYRKKLRQARTPHPDHLPLEKLCSSSPYGTEDGIQPAAMLPPKMTSEGCCGQKTELREGEKTPLMASPDAYSDNVEEPAPETSEGGLEQHLEDAEATKPGMEGLEEEVSPDPSEEQADEHLAGEERGETQLQLEGSQSQTEAQDGEGLQLQLIRRDEDKPPPAL